MALGPDNKKPHRRTLFLSEFIGDSRSSIRVNLCRLIGERGSRSITWELDPLNTAIIRANQG